MSTRCSLALLCMPLLAIVLTAAAAAHPAPSGTAVIARAARQDQILMTVQVYVVRPEKAHQSRRVGTALRRRAAAVGMIVSAPMAGTGRRQVFTVTGTRRQPRPAVAIATALRQTTPATLIIEAPITATNGQDIQIGCGRQVSYLETEHHVAGKGAGFRKGSTTVILEPGTVTKKTTVDITPSMQADGNVRLRVVMGVVHIDNVQTLTSGTSTIQLPDRSEQSVMQTAIVPIGTSLVMVGGARAHRTRVLVITPTAVTR